MAVAAPRCIMATTTHKFHTSDVLHSIQRAKKVCLINKQAKVHLRNEQTGIDELHEHIN